MDKNLLYSSNKNELKNKINQLVESKNCGKYQVPLENWLTWYNRNEENINLEELIFPNFYRSYYCDRNIFSIQIWIEDSDGIKSHVKTLYSNIPNELSDLETIFFE